MRTQIRLLRSLAIGTVAFNAICVSAAPLRPVDVEQFDVAGVRLGMSQSEAVAAISDKFGLKKSDFKFQPFPQMNAVTGTKEPQYFVVKYNGAEVMVSFRHVFPMIKIDPWSSTLSPTNNLAHLKTNLQ